MKSTLCADEALSPKTSTLCSDVPLGQRYQPKRPRRLVTTQEIEVADDVELGEAEYDEAIEAAKWIHRRLRHFSHPQQMAIADSIKQRAYCAQQARRNGGAR